MPKKTARAISKTPSKLPGSDGDGNQIHNEILLSLPREEGNDVFSNLEFVRLNHLQILHDVGDTIKSVYFCNSGMISTLNVFPDGKSVEVGLIGREGFVGLPATEANTQARRINPNFSGVNLYPTDLNSRYQSFQVNLEERLSKGFSVLANYIWSKSQDNTGPVVNPFDVHNFGRGNSTADLPNVFHLSAIWYVPNGPIQGWASKIINGWEVTEINSWQNGFRFTVYSGVDNSFSGVGSDRADFTGSNINQAIFGDRSHAQMVNQYFNTALFTVNAVGTYGNAPRNMLANPGYFNIDLGAIKNTQITERMNLQFRAEFFNVLNNVNFTVPGLGSASPNESAAGNIVGTGDFGKLTHAADPRILQFALKFIF